MAAATRSLPFVALLRGINVGGTRKVAMAELRALCEGLGWRDVRSYIQSGNVVFQAKGTTKALAAELESAIEDHFDFPVPVIVRKGNEWLRYAAKSPFPEAKTERANLLHLALAANKTTKAVLPQLEPYCKAGERLAIANGALWTDYLKGVARSKVTPAVLDRVLGAPVTARNWKTVQAIATLVREG